jgi:hypothetical protein
MTRLRNLDVRILWLLLTVVILVPMARPLGLPLSIGEPAQQSFDFVSALPEGSVVVLCYDIAPSSEAENWPQALAMTKHLMALGHRIVIMTLVPEGVMYADRVATTIAPGLGLTYGEDIVVLPYRAGQESAAAAFGENLRDLYATDHYGTPIDNLPLMADIAGIGDVDLIAAFSAGDTGLWFIRQVGAKFGTPIIVGTVGPGTPLYMVYFSSGQLVGLLNGLAGAAEYELLAKVPGKALAAMDAQSVGHGFFIILMILSNIVYFASRRAVHARGDGLLRRP